MTLPVTWECAAREARVDADRMANRQRLCCGDSRGARPPVAAAAVMRMALRPIAANRMPSDNHSIALLGPAAKDGSCV